MTFGQYLKECIKKRGISISYLTKISGVNRGKLYYVYDGKRTLTEDELFLLIDKAGFSSVDSNELVNLYFEELYGKTEFSKIKFLENAIQKDNYTGEYCGSASTDQDIKGSIENKEQLINSIAYIFYHDREIISNFSYRDKEIDNVVFALYIQLSSSLTHVMDLSTEELGEENLVRIFASLKYMYNNCFPVYRYTDIKQMKYDNIFSYYFVGEKYAVLYNDENGVFVDNADTVKIIRKNAVKVINESIPFGTRTNNVMDVKSMVDRGAKQDNPDTVIITYYPCTGKYTDYDFMYSITKEEIPERDMLVNIAFEHYSKILQNYNPYVITTSKGIEMFAETGYVQEIPAIYVNAANRVYRIEVLKNMLAGIFNEKLFILDDDKINMFPGLEFEKYSKKFIISGYDIMEENFSCFDKFISCLDDQSIINTFNNFKDYIIRSRKVYPKEYSIRFIEGLIVKLEHMNTD